ncbi:RNA methyltransferase [Rhodopirellula sp. JC740]|uniref:RNA methyltransferase n=1 Tax=Rhodopirellula halodulae TaxID=2894198 RepID=A0ABS8NKF1_9BACT|nr:RNA methyltransferase [Rhodopirellula sp. JC740]MCC9643986.1 RNA methyltransferase [Rhodopirellula sp. JC740]
MIETIHHPDDPRLAAYRNLRHRETDHGFIAEGGVVVQRLLQSGLGVHSVLIHAGRETKYLPLIPPDVPVYLIDRKLGQALAGYDFHRGILAHGIQPSFRPIEALSQQTDTSLALALVELSDPENVGSLLRSAAAMGIRDILIGPRTISPFARRVIRVSMASVFRHRFYDLNSPIEQLPQLQASGFASIATVLDDDAVPLIKLNQTLQHEKRILMVGNEGNGLPADVAAVATHRSTLPMKNETDSLNVSVASAIFLYELTRGGNLPDDNV